MYICRLLSQHPHLGCDVVPKLGPLKRSPKAPIHARGVPREIPPSYAFAACQQRMRPAPQATPQAAQAVAALHDEIIVAALLLWYDKIGPKNQLLSGVTI